MARCVKLLSFSDHCRIKLISYGLFHRGIQSRFGNRGLIARMCLAWNGKVFTARFLVQATVAYYLVLDNRRRMSTGYQGAEFDAVKVSCQGHTVHSIMLYEQRHSV
jgi:hypothetical protein